MLKIWTVVLFVIFGCCCRCYYTQDTGLNGLPRNCSGPRPTPNDTSVYNGTEFLYFHYKRVNYNGALCGCSLNSARLANIKDRATQNHIIQSMPTDEKCNRSFYYVGLFLSPDGVWRWSDGESLNSTGFSNWRSSVSNLSSCGNEPNGYRNCPSQMGSANATQINACENVTNADLGDWFDKDQFSSKWFYICQRPAEPVTITPTTRPDLTTTMEATSASTQSKTSSAVTSSPSPESTVAVELTTVPVTASNDISTTDKLSLSASKESVKPINKITTIPFLPRPARREHIETTKDCVHEFVLYPDTNTMEICSLKIVFGENFTIKKWESNISYYLGEALIYYNVTKFLKISNFSGIDIGLYRIDSLNELNEMFMEDEKNKNSFLINFNKNFRSQFQLNLETFQNFQYPFVIVTALIENQLWSRSNLTSAYPLDPIKNQEQKSRSNLNHEYKTLPSQEGLLSFSIFVRSKNSTLNVKKVSVPVNPQIEVSLDTAERISISALDRNSNHRIALDGIQYKCGFLEMKEETRWSTTGCQFLESQNGLVICKCNHTTTFGVFLAVRAFTIPTAVTLLVIGLEVITILALTLAVILLMWLKRSMNNDRTIVQINLALSLLSLHLIFLLSDYARNKPGIAFCRACAVISQYFTLTTCFWMLNEGMVLYFKTCKNALSFNLKKIFPSLSVVAWGFPLIYVALCAGVGISKGSYLDLKASELFFSENADNTSRVSHDKLPVQHNTCYVGFRNKMIYSIVVPLSIMLVITTIIIIKTSVRINAMTAELNKMKPSGKLVPARTIDDVTSVKQKRQSSISSPRKKILKRATVTLRAVVLLLPVLGITWFLGFFVNIPKAEVAFVVIHGLINGLQGVFIFYIYCVQNSHFRRVFNRKWKEFSTNFVGTDYNSNKFSRAASHMHSNHYGEYHHKFLKT